VFGRLPVVEIDGPPCCDDSLRWLCFVGWVTPLTRFEGVFAGGMVGDSAGAVPPSVFVSYVIEIARANSNRRFLDVPQADCGITLAIRTIPLVDNGQWGHNGQALGTVREETRRIEEAR